MTDQLSADLRERMVRVETKLDLLLSSREDDRRSINELEGRVRSLETGWSKLMGIAAAVSGVVSVVLSLLPHLWKH